VARLRKIFPAVLAILGLAIPGLALSGTGRGRVDLEEILSIGSLDDDLLYQWVGIGVDTDGNIYVTDAADFSVKKFDRRGKLLKRSGRRGQGPGEFMAPRALACSANRIFVTDQYLPGVQVFDKELRFLKRVPLNLLVTEIAALSDVRLACKTFEMRPRPQILIIDEDGRTISTLSYGEPDMPAMTDLVDFVRSPDGSFYLAFSHLDRIEKRSAEEKLVWTKSLFGVKKARTEKVSTLVLPADIVFKDIALDTGGNLFVLGGSYSKDRGRDVYVLSKDGRQLAAFSLPESSHCLFVDAQNFLYARANEGVTLKKYRMSYVGF
jgi:hypothetical protein